MFHKRNECTSCSSCRNVTCHTKTGPMYIGPVFVLLLLLFFVLLVSICRFFEMVVYERGGQYVFIFCASMFSGCGSLCVD